MSMDDIIVSDLNESIAGFFENRECINEDLAERMSQRYADSMNGDLKGLTGFVQRNKLSAGAGVDHIAASLQNRLTNPQYIMSTLPRLGQNAASGAQRAAMEREEKMQQRALAREQRDLANEQKKVQRERNALEKELSKNATGTAPGVTNEAILPAMSNIADKTVGRAYDWGFNTASGGSNSIVKPTVTGSNVETITLKNGKQIGIATDTRGTAQRRVDALADMGKGLADNYLQSGIENVLAKGSDLLGYGAAKAKFAIEDMRAKKAQAKIEAQKLREQKDAIKNQKTT